MRSLGLRLRAGVQRVGPAMLAGAFTLFALTRALDPAGGRGVSLLVFGALMGLAIWSLMRLFAVRGWGLVVAGMLCGPMPLALLWRVQNTSSEDRGGQLLVGLALGAAIGALEHWRAERESDSV